MECVVAPCNEFSVDLDVSTLSFSPYEWSSSLCAVGGRGKIVIAQLTQNESDGGLGWEVLDEILCSDKSARVVRISWSPDTSLSVLPKCVRLAAATTNHTVTLYTTDMTDVVDTQVLGHHSDYINDVCMDSESGRLVATVSDDHMCKVWSTDAQQGVVQFLLSSPGVSCCWHKEDSGKLLVAEKRGIIRFYSLSAEQPIMSIDTRQTNILSADWCPNNPLLVIALSNNSFYMWDISRPSRPLMVKPVLHTAGRDISFYSGHAYYIAVTSHLSHLVKVIYLKTGKVVLVGQSKSIHGLSWHQRLPYVAVGGDNKVCLWKLDVYN